MFCSKCGAKTDDDAAFCSKCGKSAGSESAEENVQALSVDREAEEHIIARAEISWGPFFTAIVCAVLFLALYFLLEMWLLKPELNKLVISAFRDDGKYFYPHDVEQQVNHILNYIRIPLVVIEIISIILSLLVRARQFLYVTNKRIIGNAGHLFWIRSLNVPLSQVKELRIRKAFSLIPHTSVIVNRLYDFQIKEGQEFKMILEELVKDALAKSSSY